MDLESLSTRRLDAFCLFFLSSSQNYVGSPKNTNARPSLYPARPRGFVRVDTEVIVSFRGKGLNFKPWPGSGTGAAKGSYFVRWVSGHPVNELELGGIGMRGFFDRRLPRL